MAHLVASHHHHYVRDVVDEEKRERKGEWLGKSDNYTLRLKADKSRFCQISQLNLWLREKDIGTEADWIVAMVSHFSFDINDKKLVMIHSNENWLLKKLL